MVKTVRNVSNRLKSMGERPKESFLRSANFIFFGLALFFCLIYFVAATVDEVNKSGGVNAFENTNKYLK